MAIQTRQLVLATACVKKLVFLSFTTYTYSATIVIVG
jgi:hypothetical protein